MSLILAADARWIRIARVRLALVNMLSGTLGAPGAFANIWRLNGVMSIWTVLRVATLVASTGIGLGTSAPEARAECTGASFSPAALGGRRPDWPAQECVWQGCCELGTFGHIVWTCPRRPAHTPISLALGG